MPRGVGDKLNLSERSCWFGVWSELVKVLMFLYSKLDSNIGSASVLDLVVEDCEASSFCIKRTWFYRSTKSYCVYF